MAVVPDKLYSALIGRGTTAQRIYDALYDYVNKHSGQLESVGGGRDRDDVPEGSISVYNEQKFNVDGNIVVAKIVSGSNDLDIISINGERYDPVKHAADMAKVDPKASNGTALTRAFLDKASRETAFASTQAKNAEITTQNPKIAEALASNSEADIREMQALLKFVGHDPGIIDGDRTRADGKPSNTDKAIAKALSITVAKAREIPAARINQRLIKSIAEQNADWQKNRAEALLGDHSNVRSDDSLAVQTAMDALLNTQNKDMDQFGGTDGKFGPKSSKAAKTLGWGDIALGKKGAAAKVDGKKPEEKKPEEKKPEEKKPDNTAFKLDYELDTTGAEPKATHAVILAADNSEVDKLALTALTDGTQPADVQAFFRKMAGEHESVAVGLGDDISEVIGKAELENTQIDVLIALFDAGDKVDTKIVQELEESKTPDLKLRSENTGADAVFTLVEETGNTIDTPRGPQPDNKVHGRLTTEQLTTLDNDDNKTAIRDFLTQMHKGKLTDQIVPMLATAELSAEQLKALTTMVTGETIEGDIVAELGKATKHAQIYEDLTTTMKTSDAPEDLVPHLGDNLDAVYTMLQTRTPDQFSALTKPAGDMPSYYSVDRAVIIRAMRTDEVSHVTKAFEVLKQAHANAGDETLYDNPATMLFLFKMSIEHAENSGQLTTAFEGMKGMFGNFREALKADGYDVLQSIYDNDKITNPAASVKAMLEHAGIKVPDHLNRIIDALPEGHKAIQGLLDLDPLPDSAFRYQWTSASMYYGQSLEDEQTYAFKIKDVGGSPVIELMEQKESYDWDDSGINWWEADLGDDGDDFVLNLKAAKRSLNEAVYGYLGIDDNVGHTGTMSKEEWSRIQEKLGKLKTMGDPSADNDVSAKVLADIVAKIETFNPNASSPQPVTNQFGP